MKKLALAVVLSAVTSAASATTLNVGDTMDLNVLGSSAAQTSTFEITFTSAVKALFTLVDATDSYTNVSYKLDPAWSSPETMTLRDQTDPATISFTKIIAAGTYNLDIWNWADALTAGTAQYSHSTVSVSAVPLPGAAWLFGSGLLGFMMLSNRRKV